MLRIGRISVSCAIALITAAAWAQFPSATVGFNGPPIDAETAQEMFRLPEFSPTTLAYIQANTSGFNNNNAFRASGLQTEGDAAMQVFFRWTSTSNPDAWVRLSTFNGAERPNPSLDTEGKVRFKLTNRSELFRGRFGIVLGIRETGVIQPQLRDGGTTGDIEWVGVSTTPNGIIAGADGIVNTAAAGDDVQVHPVGADIIALGLPVGTAVVDVGPNGALDTTPAGDDQVRSGYFIAADGGRTPVPAFTFAPSASPYTVEFDLATGDITVNGVPHGGGFAGFVGDGNLSAANNRGVLEHIAFTKVATDTAALIDMAIDELQFEATVPDPVLPPSVVSPIVNNDTQVTVSDLMSSVDRVNLLRNHSVIAFQNVTSSDPVVFNLPQPAAIGEVYSATQRDSVTGQTSAESLPVTVLAAPPPYSFSILLDEGGTGSCTFAAPGWEWVGVSSVSGFVPQGTPIVPSDGVWQTVDIPLDNPSLVRAALGGNGALAPSPTGFYTMDSVWFTIRPGADASALGPWEVFIDGVQAIDQFDQPSVNLLSIEDGVNRFPSSRGQSSELPDATGVSAAGSYDGGSSQRLVWTYDNTDGTRTLGMLQRVGAACGTSALIPDDSRAIRFHLLFRQPPAAPEIALPVVESPLVGEQTTVRVDNDPAALSVQLFINGEPAGSPVVPSGPMTDFNVTLALGDSVSATQTLVTGTSDLAYPRAAAEPLPPVVVAPILINATSVTVQGLLTSTFATTSSVHVFSNGVEVGSAAGGATSVVVTTAALPSGAVITATQIVNGVESLHSTPVVVGQPPAPPTVSVPLEAGNQLVRLTNVNPLASLVTVYDGTTAIGSINPAGLATVDVPVTPLVHLGQISASASNSSGESPRSAPTKEVGRGNGDVLICLGIRETGTLAPLGGNGGSANGIEWLGASSAVGGAPQGRPISASSAWQTITFTPGVDPVVGFAGTTANGVLESANGRGTIEHIAVTVNNPSPNRSVGTYVMYIDNIVNVGADGGSDFVVSNFDSFTDGTEVMFQEPGFSGSTSANLEVAPATLNVSQISSEQANGGKSVKLVYYFRDTAANRWVRLTTFNTAVLPNPTIDLTRPIQMDVLLLEVLPPSAPVVEGPIEQGGAVVTVSGILPTMTLVRVFANGSPIGSINPAGADTVDVPVSGLIHLDQITAQQSGPGGTSPVSTPVEVGIGNGAIRIAIGVRETGDAGPLGSPGGTTGAIEWIGAATATDGAPQGIAVDRSNAWQTLTFDPVAGPVLSFSGGNGAIDGTRGTLEHLAVSVNAASPNRSSGAYELYIDNVVNVGAGPGGSDFVIEDFEGLAVDDEALFQEPTFSGSTSANLTAQPSFSGVATRGNPGQSEVLEWFYRDTTAQRWVRITTTSVANTPSPIIDLTRPIRMDVLLVDSVVPGDVNGDGHVTLTDLAQLLGAFGACEGQLGYIAGADFNGSHCIDLPDLAILLANFGL